MPNAKHARNQFPLDRPWRPRLNWSMPAGRTLRALVRALPAKRRYGITVFGSAPRQMAVDPLLLSADVDTFSEEHLDEIVAKAKLGKGQSEVCIQVCYELNFKTSPKWKDRAFHVQIKLCTLRFPHPIDILIGKLNRLEEKDVEAFRIVIQKTGHPTERELIRELQDAVDLFRPRFDEERSGDPINNTRALWATIFGHDIDVRKDIIVPALVRRRTGYGEPGKDHRKELALLGKRPARRKRKRE